MKLPIKSMKNGALKGKYICKKCTLQIIPVRLLDTVWDNYSVLIIVINILIDS